MCTVGGSAPSVPCQVASSCSETFAGKDVGVGVGDDDGDDPDPEPPEAEAPGDDEAPGGTGLKEEELDPPHAARAKASTQGTVNKRRCARRAGTLSSGMAVLSSY
jgi:hypothetical protein